IREPPAPLQSQRSARELVVYPSFRRLAKLVLAVIARSVHPRLSSPAPLPRRSPSKYHPESSSPALRAPLRTPRTTADPALPKIRIRGPKQTNRRRPRDRKSRGRSEERRVRKERRRRVEGEE